MRPTYCDSCDRSLDPYLPDCPHCGAHIEHDDEHHDRDLKIRRGNAHHAHVEVHRAWKFHVPWGLFLILGLYGGGAYAYMQYSAQTTPPALAKTHLLRAQELMGPDDGDTAKDAALFEAYGELLEALNLNPGDAWGHQQLEKIEWALAKRGKRVPDDLKRRADFLGTAYASIQAGKQSQLPVSPRERYDIDGLEDQAVNLPRYFVLGAVIIFMLWMYKEFQNYKFHHKRDDEHEVLRREELRALNAHRKRGA